MNSEKSIKYEFSYEKKREEIYTPKAKVILKSPANQNIVKCEGIVDTGSEITLISSELIQELQLPVGGIGEKINTAGLGEAIYVLPCWGQISFYDKNIESKYKFIKIYSCQRNFLSQDILLGMNFINKYTITFSGKYKKLFVMEENTKE